MMPRIRWLIIWLCFLANAVSYIDRANLAIAAPAIRAELGIDAAAMGLVLSAFFWIVLQFISQLFITLQIITSSTSTSDRVNGHFPILDAHQQFG